MRLLDREAAELALLGGWLLGCGGGGQPEDGRALAEEALRRGTPRIVGLDELADDALVVTVSLIGAPAAPEARVAPEDYPRALELLCAAEPGEIAAIMTSETGASSVANGWLQSAILGIPVADAAGNGRGHPTIKMGALGLAGDATFTGVQTAAGGDRATGRYLEVVARGGVLGTASVLHHAADVAGGMMAAARLPLPVRFVRERAAVGALSFAIRVGRVMRDGAARGATGVLDALRQELGARVLAVGRVVTRRVETRQGFDVGRFVIDGGEGRCDLVLVNEFLAVERAGDRLATFPDVIAVLSLESGEPRQARDLAEGERAAVIVLDRSCVPLGAGVFDPAAYPDVEALAGVRIFGAGP